MADESNQELFLDRYRRHYQLGQGGSGQVWKCLDTILDKDVAVKVLKEGYDTVKAKQRFQIEAKALAKLKHKNIVSILDFGESRSGDLYMVMEHIDGVSLKQLIEDRGKLDKDDSIEIAIQILNGLDKAHKEGFVHRDIKPSNILVYEDEQSRNNVKILDFGVARMANADEQRQTPPGLLIGSPLYMSPESARGMDLDSRADIYSFGCLLFECLTGRVPFRGDSASETLMMHIESNPPLDEIEDDFFREIVSSCLKKDPEERISSIDILMEKLINFRPELDLEELIKEKEPEREVPAVSKSGEMRKFFWFFSLLTGISLVFYGVLQIPQPMQKVKPGKSHGLPSLEELSTKPRKEGIYRDGSRIKCGANVKDADIKEYLAKNDDIGSWAFGRCDITDNGIKLLDLNKLTNLDLTDTVITDETLKYLKNAKHLKVLELKICPRITLDGLSYISDLPVLHNLSFAGKELSPQWSKALANFKNLDSLTYEGSIDSQDARNFAKIKKLSTLRISPVEDDVLAEILKIKTLVFLHISRGPLSTRAVRLISKSSLQVADLHDVVVNRADVNSFFINQKRKMSVYLPKNSYPPQEIKRLNKLSGKVVFTGS